MTTDTRMFVQEIMSHFKKDYKKVNRKAMISNSGVWSLDGTYDEVIGIHPISR